MKHFVSRLCLILLLSGATLVSSCTRIGNFAEKRANKAAYGNIMGAQQRGLGTSDEFTIDDSEGQRIRKMLEEESNAEEPVRLSLGDTLAIAIANSRSYQARKESLFIEALNLTETQKDFNWDTSNSRATAGTSYTTEPRYKNQTVVKGGKTNVVQVFDGTISETFSDNGVDGKLDLSVTRTLLSGAKVTLGFTQEITDYFTNPGDSSESSTLSLNVVQPLLNGFGPLVSKEPLRQASRNMVYAVRDFRRYQQNFVIDITSQYYSTLSSRDQLINAKKNYESTVASREQTESYAKAGRIADFEAAQARQSELNAADRWATERAGYERSLDDFRHALGLPVNLNLEPDPNELVQLSERGLIGLDIVLEEAVDVAASNRLDLITRRARVEDRERFLEIQRRNFLPNLDVSYDVSYDLKESSEEGLGQESTVSLNIPFDWTEKRNNYRIAQINLDREIRNLEEDEWDVRREVRNLWRNLERNRSVYKNRLLSVELAERRVESTTLLLKQGKALTRDLLDSQDDLLSSKNQATAALVDYTMNRLRFWNAIERFEIDPKGMWYEQQNRHAEEPVATP